MNDELNRQLAKLAVEAAKLLLVISKRLGWILALNVGTLVFIFLGVI